MAKIKTSEAIDAALDWAVARCEGFDPETLNTKTGVVYSLRYGVYSPSNNWGQGGPILDRRGITPIRMDDGWIATHLLCKRAHDMYGYDVQEIKYSGSTPLIAAMRAYVAYKMGPEIDVPDELMAQSAPKNRIKP